MSSITSRTCLRRAVRTVAALSLTLTVTAAPALADFASMWGADVAITDPSATACIAPTAAQCLDPVYQESECGRQQIAADACDHAVASTMSTATTTGTGFSRTEAGEYIFADTLVAKSTSGDLDSMVGSSYVGELGRYAAEQRNPALGSWLWWKPSASSKRAAWEANGNRVGSCEELAYEGWWTFSKFDDEVGKRGANGRAIYDAARAVGLGAGQVRGRDGDPIRRPDGSTVPGLPFPSSKIPKNAYFLFQRTAFDKLPFPDYAIPPVAGRSFYDGNWAWHTAMDADMKRNLWPDELLDGEYDRQKRFLRLLDRRAVLLDELFAEAAATMVSSAPAPDLEITRLDDSFLIGLSPYTDGPAVPVESAIGTLPSTTVTSMVSASRLAVDASEAGPHVLYAGGYTGTLGKLFVLDHKILAELSLAAGMGCLDTTTTSVCDWSPRLFADLVGRSYVKEREEEYQRCLYLTGDDFSDTSPLATPETFDLLDADWRATASMVRGYLNVYQHYLDNLDFASEPGSPGNPSIGWWRDNSRWLGNDEFGAGYGYKFGFGLVKAEEAGACVMNFKAQAQANASVRVAGEHLDLLDSDTYGVTSAADVFTVHSHTTLLGYPLYTPIDEVYTATSTTPVWHTEKEFSARATFWIGPVPVTGEVGVAGKAGITVGTAITLDRTCTDTPQIDLSGQFTVTPYVKADAFIGAMIGARGLGVGLRTDLNLADISAPLTVTANIHGKVDAAHKDRSTEDKLAMLATSTVATVSVDLGLTVDSLAGSITGIVETPIKNWHRTIFSWEGKRLVDEKWEKSYRFPMAAIISKLGS